MYAAYQVKPDSADALCGFALLKMHEDDVEGAEALYQSAISAGTHFTLFISTKVILYYSFAALKRHADDTEGAEAL